MNKLALYFWLAFCGLAAAQSTGGVGGGTGSGGSGTVTSVGAGCQAKALPNPITGSGVISTVILLSGNSPVVTTPYGVQTSDLCDILLLNAGASTVTLSNPATTTGFGNGTYVLISNQTGATVTLSPIGGTIDGDATKTVPTSSVIGIQSDGTNFHYFQEPQAASGSSTITAGTTVTASITSGDIIASQNNLIFDTKTAYNSLAILSGLNTFTNTNTFTSPVIVLANVTPTMVASDMIVGGNIPTFGANGEAAVYPSLVNGAVIQGQGANASVTLVGAGGVSSCAMTAGGALTCSLGITAAGGALTGNNNAASQNVSVQGRNNSANAAAATQFNLGNNTAVNEFNIVVNSSANTSGNIGNSSTLNGIGGLYFQGNAVNALSIAPSGIMSMYSQVTTGTTTFAVCAGTGANGTGGGQIILVSGAAATCVSASALRFKNLLDTVFPAQAEKGLDKLRIGAPVWDYKDTSRFGSGPHVGLIADDVIKMDPRCGHYDAEGVTDYEDRCVMAYLVADRQKMKAEIEDLKRRIH